MVNDNKIKVKSDETRISEKLLSSFRTLITRLERELDTVTSDLASYTSLDGHVKQIVSGEVEVDLDNSEHLRAVAYLKKNVNTLLKIDYHGRYKLY